jgi:iron(III) transport system substrate-binding protein
MPTTLREVPIKINCTLTFALLAALCLTNSGTGQAQTKDRAKLMEAAKKEGKVMVYVSSNASDARALEAAFEKKYPFINMEFYNTGKDALLSRYMLEARTRNYLADVYQSSVFPIINLVEKGLLAKYESPEREGYIDALRDKDGYWNAMYLNAVTMAYNSRMLKPDEVPSSYQQLLLPKWKGKMGFVLSHTEWYFAMLQSMGEEKGRHYMEALSKQNIQARIGSSLMNQLMMAGEFPLLISQYSTGVEELKKTGAPIDWVALDPWFVYPIGIAVTANNSHPAAARLYVDFILSEEGQTTLRQLSRIPARKDVLPNPPRLMQGRKLFVIKPASSAVYNKYNAEMLRYFR